MVLRIFILSSIITVAFAAVVIFKPDSDGSYCICHHGYSVQKHEKDGRFYCKGVLHEGQTACVTLERPKCKCTLIKGFIIQDIYGYWCVKVKPGFIEEIRWDCENKSEWDRFLEIYPEERPTANTQL